MHQSRRLAILRQGENDNIRLHPFQIDRDAWARRNCLRQQPGMGMVLPQPLRHLSERDQPRGRQHTHLPHAAAQGFAHRPRLRHQLT